MLDFVYTLLIAPLEFWMHKALVWGFDQTQTWGWAIVVMSLVVNIVILPIYMKAENWQEEERAIRKGFEDKETMLKKAFKGQERFAMITTMHRQAGYSPFLSMRSSIGFFLQIPFFFAAYHFLSHFEPLQGVSFLGLADLSKPDEMIALGGFSINVMPILMTVINLASALIYTHNLSRRDKMQLYGMAALFLVLLYDAASGLVLYWTCNNIFSLGKNIVYDLYHRYGSRVSGRLMACLPKRSVSQEPVIKGSWKSGYLFYLWAIGSIFGLLSSNQITVFGESTKVTLSYISDFVYVAVFFLCLFEAVRLRIWKKHFVLMLVSAVVFYYCMRIWGRWFFFGGHRHYFAAVTGILFLVPVIGITNLKTSLKTLLFPRYDVSSLYTPAVSWLIILITAYLPIQAFCTAPEAFSQASDVLALLLRYSLTGVVLFWVLYKLFGACRKLNFAGYFFAFLALLCTVYAFLLPIDVGTIDGFQLEKSGPLYADKNLLVDALTFAVFISAFVWLIRIDKVQLLRTVFMALIVIGIGASTVSLWQSKGKWQSDESKTLAELPSYNDRLLAFSKDKPNIVVVLLDAFTGSHVGDIMKDDALREKYRGFTWYSNTLSTSSSTQSSLASVLCGENCSPWKLNEDTSLSIADKINKHYADVINHFGPDIDVAVHERNWLETNRIKEHLTGDPLLLRYLGDSYLNRYIQKNNIEIGRGSSDSFLLAVSIFNSVPWSLKNLIYKDGRWIERLMPSSDMWIVRQMREYAFLDGLRENSNTASTKATFKFLGNETSHRFWFLDWKNCTFSPNPVVYDELKGYNEPLHPGSEKCALSALGLWFDWMRQAGIYENTMIVLASDHDAGDSEKMAKTVGGIGVRRDGLLLVKNLHADVRQELKTSMELHSIYDVPQIIDANLGKSDWPNDDARTTVLSHGNSGTFYRTDKPYKVKGLIEERSSWQPVE